MTFFKKAIFLLLPCAPACLLACIASCPTPHVNWRNPSRFLLKSEHEFFERAFKNLPEDHAREHDEIGAFARAKASATFDAQNEFLKNHPDGNKTLYEAYVSYRAFWKECQTRINREPCGCKKIEAVADLRLPEILLEKMPQGLSPLYAAYERGRAYYLARDWKAAEDAFAQTETLAGAQGHSLQLKACYLRARSLQAAGRPDEALLAYARVRELSQQGIPDPDGLALETFGWEGQIFKNRADYARAFRRFLFLEEVCRRDFGSWQVIFPMALKKLAADDFSREWVSRWFASGLDHNRLLGAWVAALNEQGGAPSKLAGRLALAAYNAGDFDTAKDCLSLALPDDLLAQWIRSKFLFMGGDSKAAARIMADLFKRVDVSAFSADNRDALSEADAQSYAYPHGVEKYRCYHSFHRWPADWRGCDVEPKQGRERIFEKITAEAALLFWEAKDYALAVDCFLDAGCASEALFVAELAMDIETLRAYVRDRADCPYLIRLALAKRLMLEGDFEGAKPYFEGADAEFFKNFLEARRLAQDTALPDAVRAVNYWKLFAACKFSSYFFKGCFQPTHCDEQKEDVFWPEYIESIIVEDFCADATADAAADAVNPLARAQYPMEKHPQYLAAEYAWRAAALVQDKELKAKLLIVGAQKIKARSPRYADKFYKELVRACRPCDLAVQADKRRWFPAVSDTPDDLLAELERYAQGGGKK